MSLLEAAALNLARRGVDMTGALGPMPWARLLARCTTQAQRDAVFRRLMVARYRDLAAYSLARAGEVRRSLAHWRRREPGFVPDQRVYRHGKLARHYRLCADHYGFILP